MQAAGRAICAPMIILAAEADVRRRRDKNRIARRTDIAPDKGGDLDVARPDDGVDAVDHVNNKKPGNHSQGCDVPRPPVPWEGDEDEESSDEGYVGQFGVHCAWAERDVREGEYGLCVPCLSSGELNKPDRANNGLCTDNGREPCPASTMTLC